MKKLYREWDGVVVDYHEAWIRDDQIIEHWGKVGQRGESRSHRRTPSLSDSDNLGAALAQATENGFRPLGDDDRVMCIVEYSIEGMGTGEDIDKRHVLEGRLNEIMGWTGLGHVDGGSIGSGTMEVCCIVVNFDCAKRVIENNLKETKFANFTRIYMAAGS